MATPPPPPSDLDLSLPDDPPPNSDETRVLPTGASSTPTAPAPQPALHFESDEVTRIMPSPVRWTQPPANPDTPRPSPALATDSDEGPTLIRLNPPPPPPSPRQSPPQPATSNEPSTLVRPELAAPLAAPAPAFTARPTGPDDTTLSPARLNTTFDTGTTPLPGAASADPGPRQVGRYQVRSRLGRGGMATVYRAHDPSIGRDVAIKFLHASLAEDEECKTRFLRESRAAGGLSHPNIVVVHDVGEIDGRPFMAMELLEGQSLAELLDAHTRMSIRDVTLLGVQLAGALEYAHTRGVVHRDIKPGNIMLLGDKSGVKVTDFGIAHFEEAGMQQQTLVGAVLGTPQYMSPEQTRGEKIDGRSDLFSVGIVLYQALTGERPFKGDNVVAVAQQIATGEAPPINAKRPDTPPALRRVVEKCLAKNPAQRWASGAELGAALRRVLEDIDSIAAENNKPRIVPLRVKWALMMAGIVAVVMGLTAAVIAQRQYTALMAQAQDYGAALTRFIAQQNAAAVLGEEWEVVDIAVQETMKTRNFERITVIDNTGTVRVSTLAGLAGQPYKPPQATRSLGALAGDVAASRYTTSGGAMLGFEAPVMYRDRQVGRVALGVPEQPLAAVARLSITLMLVLALVTVLAVAVAMYFVANWFARPIKLVVDSMGELARGHYGHRIAEPRKDEFGELFLAFDRLATALQQREQGAAGSKPGADEPRA